MLICQSCGMDIENDSFKGTDANGDLSCEYCSYCYQSGEYTNDVTLDQMVDIGLNYSPDYKNAETQVVKDTIRTQARQYLSNLKRWVR